MYEITKEKQKIAEAIKSQCKEKKISLSALAEKSGVSKSTLSMIMNGKSLPYLHTLYQICNALDISVNDILEEESRDIQEVPALSLDEDEKHILDTYRAVPERKKDWLLQAVELLDNSGKG